MELLTSWAAKEDLTILGDLLPGMFGPYYQMSTLHMAIACETAEYLPGKIMMLVYGNKAMSASNGLELAKYLQLEGNTDDPDIAEYYYFSLGEPSFAGKRSEIVKFAEDETIHICRVDLVESGAQDGIFFVNEEYITGSDTDPSDGWTAGDGSFAIFGVMKPYQLKEDEIVPNENMYGFYDLLNGADTLLYTFTAADGSGEIKISKQVGVSRIKTIEDKLDPAVYEFYSIFPEGTLKEGTAYTLTVQAYDRNGTEIQGAVCQIELKKK